MRRPLTCLIALCLCAAAAPARAGAKPLDGTYRGKTSQGFKTAVKVKGGVVESVNLPWVGKCRNKRYRWGPMKPFTWTNDPKDPIEQSGNHFGDSGKSVRDVKGEHSVSKGYMKGHFSGKRVSGVQDIKVHVTYKGEKDYCHARIHWSAKLVG